MTTAPGFYNVTGDGDGSDPDEGIRHKQTPVDRSMFGNLPADWDASVVTNLDGLAQCNAQ